MLFYTGIVLLLGSGIGIGVGIGAGVWKKDPKVVSDAGDGFCPAAFSDSLMAVSALAKCNSDYVSIQSSKTTPRTCLKHLAGKGPIKVDNPVFPIWASLPMSHPAKAALQNAPGTWIFPRTLGCPINLNMLNWVNGLYPSIQAPPLACSADVEASFLLHALVYDWEHALGLSPDQGDGSLYKSVWAKLGYVFPGAYAGSPITMPEGAPGAAQIKTWFEKVINGEGPDPYSPTNAAFTYGMTAIGGLHLTFVVDALIRSIRHDANDPTKPFSIDIVYSGPSTPSCNRSMGPLPAFEKGSTVKVFGYEEDSELTHAEHALSLQTFYKAQMTCATATTTPGVLVIPFYEIYGDQVKWYPAYVEASGFRSLPKRTVEEFRAEAAASPWGSKMLWLGA